jgi:hypothetical protein
LHHAPALHGGAICDCRPRRVEVHLLRRAVVCKNIVIVINDQVCSDVIPMRPERRRSKSARSSSFWQMMTLPRSYRRLIRKTTRKTITRSPREPGQTNQPPPLEYPATKHPESPKVATDAANSLANFVDTDNTPRTLSRFCTSTLHSMSQSH